MNTSTTAHHESSADLLRGLLGPCLRGAAFVALTTGVAYPLATTGVAQLLLPQTASGSLIRQDERVVGSRLIGQHFTATHYFHSRPSATTGANPDGSGSSVSQPYNAGASLGSNQGPTNAALIEAVRQRTQDYRASHGLPADAMLPADAVTASASGLDPHISVANARMQARRVAQARQLPLEKAQALIEQHIEGRLLGLLGEPRVNVLLLNLALDEQASKSTRPASGNAAGDHHVR
ncbi:MAG: K(+)-transporting ATPase subunit C [Burkholderiales bacterium]|nr:K(+)-transporting ATPase subunit C [Burkholderiales bacterium]